jgi:hypothetical protein
MTLIGILPVGRWSADVHAILRGPVAGQFKKVVDPVTGEEIEQKFWYVLFPP